MNALWTLAIFIGNIHADHYNRSNGEYVYPMGTEFVSFDRCQEVGNSIRKDSGGVVWFICEPSPVK